MGPADEFASLLLFYARDGFAGLRNLVGDHGVVGPLRRESSALRASQSSPGSSPQLAAALGTSAHVAARLGGLRRPSDRGRPPPSRRTRRAARLADAEPSDTRSLAGRRRARRSVAGAGVRPRSFVRRQMLLDTSYLNAVSAGATWRTRAGSDARSSSASSCERRGSSAAGGAPVAPADRGAESRQVPPRAGSRGIMALMATRSPQRRRFRRGVRRISRRRFWARRLVAVAGILALGGIVVALATSGRPGHGSRIDVRWRAQTRWCARGGCRWVSWVWGAG